MHTDCEEEGEGKKGKREGKREEEEGRREGRDMKALCSTKHVHTLQIKKGSERERDKRARGREEKGRRMRGSSTSGDLAYFYLLIEKTHAFSKDSYRTIST